MLSILRRASGPTLNGTLSADGLGDESVTTIGSLVVRDNGTPTPVRGDAPPSLQSVTGLALVSPFLSPETSEACLR